MSDCRDAGAVLSECLGVILNTTQRSLESLLESDVDGLVAFREVGVDVAEGRSKVQLFIYDHLPKLRFLNDIKVRPNHYQTNPSVYSQLKQGLYDRFFVTLEGELLEVDLDSFKTLFNSSVVYHFANSQTTDYFYV